MTAPKERHTDATKLLDNAAGPVEFRVNYVPCRMGVSGPGLLKSWQGNAFDAGERFTGSDTIIATGRFELTLDGAGYLTLQEPLE